jgi:PAS domain S-box-containing protein
MVITTDKGSFLECNDAFISLFGYSGEDLSAMNAKQLWMRPSDRLEWLKAVKENESVVAFPSTQRRKDGSVIHVQLTTSIRMDQSGRLLYQSIIRDVTERLRMEKELKSRNELLQLFVEYAPAAVAMCDLQMNYLAYSRRWITDYGLKDENLLGQCHYDVFKTIPDQWKIEYQRCLQGEVFHSQDEPFERQDGTLDWVRRSLHPWYRGTNDVGGLIMFTEVITKRKKAEEEREVLINELQQALAEVKALSGLLPICSACKKIRDDKGYWQQIEGYIMAHSDTQFSHGLCPDCAKKLYPHMKFGD